MYKAKNDLCPKPVQDLFKRNENPKHFRNERDKDWFLPETRTVNYGLESIRYRGPKTWSLVPNEIKSLDTLESFKEKIKSWKPEGCTCRLCKTYIKDLGFIQ